MKLIISSLVFTLLVFLNSIELSSQSRGGINLDLTLGRSQDLEPVSPRISGRGRVSGPVTGPSHSSANQHRIPNDGGGWITITDGAPGQHSRGPLYGHGEPGLSGITRGSYPAVHVSDCIFYQAGPHDYRIVTGSLPVVVRGNYIIGRFDNGFLRPIYNHKRDIIKVHRTDNVQVLITPAEYKEFGMNNPITRENTINYRPSQLETIVLDK